MKKLMMASVLPAVASLTCLISVGHWLASAGPASTPTIADASKKPVALANEAEALHKAGKHADSVEKTEDASAAINLQLKMKKWVSTLPPGVRSGPPG